MHCEDNGKLRTPLNEVCMTSDIGCVPIVTGKPTCSPQPDELPIAYDKISSTLWLFSCDTREWLAFGKFSICQLSALNLDNIRNICDVLNIAVNYGGSGECVQGTVTLGELAQRIFECLQLETKIVTIAQGEGNKVKITIDGLPLDSVYVQGHNIWSEGGSGTEADPLVVATYDPICKWPVKNQAEVDAATTKHLGACVDGEMSRVPFPLKICELPARNQAQVDAAQSVEIAACVDGEGVKIPYTKPEPPVCEADQLTLEQVEGKGSNITIVGCDEGNVVRIPIQNSGFFSYNTDWKYLCVPSVTAVPQGAPVEGSGPFRVGCNGELYVWLCESDASGRWEEIRFNPNGLDNLNIDNVSNLCNNFRMMGWYSNIAGDPCVEEVKFTLNQLVDMVVECAAKNCHPPYEERRYYVTSRLNGDRSARPKNVNLVSLASGVYNIATYQSNNNTWIFGSGEWNQNRETGETVGETRIDLVNNSDCMKIFTLDTFIEDGFNEVDESRDYWVSSMAALYEVSKSDYNTVFDIGDAGSLPPNVAKVGYYSKDKHIDGRFMHINPSTGSADIPSLMGRLHGHALQNMRIVIPPGESRTYYLGIWMTITSKETFLDGSLVSSGPYGSVIVRAYNGLKF